MFRTIVIFLGLFCCSGAQAQAETRAAFVVGNSNYENASNLANPVRDAALVGNTLQDLGFDVTRHSDLTRAEFSLALGSFLQKTKDADVTVFYFAGHGMQFDGKNYLVATDAALRTEFDVESETIALDKVVTALQRNSKAALVFVDACRDNPLATDFYRRNFSETRALNTRGLARVQGRMDGSMLVFAAAPGQVAYDGEGQNSPFATALAKHLPTPGAEVLSLTKRIIGDVRDATDGAQSPIVTNDLTREIFLREAVLKPAPETVSEEPNAEEDEVFAAASRLSTLHGWSHYFKLYPNGVHKNRALAAEHTILKLELTHLAADWGDVDFDIQITPTLSSKLESRFGLDRSDRLVVQALLSRQGYYDGALDGVLGLGSRNAIRAFQSDRGLEPTGIVTRATADALGAGLAQRYLEPAASSVRRRSVPQRFAKTLKMDERLQGWLRRVSSVDLIYGFRDGHLYVAHTSGITKHVYERLSPLERKRIYAVSITSADENRYVYDLVRHDVGFWYYEAKFNQHAGPVIGLTQGPDAREPSGDWMWDSGEESTYRNWDRNQPDDFRNEDFVHLWLNGRRYSRSPDLANGARWNDIQSFGTPLILELE